jgi:predicted Zn-dependent protease
MERLRGARLLDPDRYWELTRARYLLLRDRPVRALRTANGLVREEPDNLDAWIIVREAAREVDPRRAARALAEIRRLNPRLTRRR